MNFAELVAEVQIWVKQPAMEGAIRSAIRAVTLKYHRRDKFWRDLTTVAITNLPSDAVQYLDIATHLPYFRQLKHVEGCEIMEFDDLVDLDGFSRYNVAMMAGTNLNIKRESPITGLNVTYYRDPIVTEGGYTSWIAETQPDLIICGAAARALAWNAESEIFRAAKTEEMEQIRELLANNIEGIGR